VSNQVLSTVPQGVDINIYSRDTFPLRITVDGLNYSQHTWSAQIRSNHDAPIDAEFEVYPDATGANLILTSEAVGQLADLGKPIRSLQGSSLFLKYSGVWDVQVEDAGIVTTLVQGFVNVYADVTRLT
jgi:hypothetical protein